MFYSARGFTSSVLFWCFFLYSLFGAVASSLLNVYAYPLYFPGSEAPGRGTRKNLSFLGFSIALLMNLACYFDHPFKSCNKMDLYLACYFDRTSQTPAPNEHVQRFDAIKHPHPTVIQDTFHFTSSRGKRVMSQGHKMIH